MKRMIEVTAKTVEDAISDGLKQLGITMDEADIKVINSGGLFKKAKVEISYEVDEPVKAPIASEKKEELKKEEFKKPEPKKEEPKKTEPKKEEPKKTEQKKEEPKKTEPKKEEKKPIFEPKKVAPPSEAQTPKKTFLKKEVTESAKAFEPSQKPQEGTKSEARQSDRGRDNRRDRKPYNPKPSVSAPITDEKRTIATEFLTQLLKHMSIEGEIKIAEDNGMRITIDTADSAIIGYRGEVLDSIQYLTSLKVNEGQDKAHVLLSVDALGYREKRVETLKKLAQRTAEKCLKSNRRVSLEPMNSADRRIIHAELSENDMVITRSEGHEPTRRIVVFPKR